MHEKEGTHLRFSGESAFLQAGLGEVHLLDAPITRLATKIENYSFIIKEQYLRMGIGGFQI